MSDTLKPLNPTERPRVLLVVPTQLNYNVHTVTWMFSQASKQVAVLPFLHKRGGAFVEDMRQAVTEEFLATGIDWLFMLDADTIPKFQVAKAIIRAESIDAKIVCYPTPFIGPYPGVASNVFLAGQDPDNPESMILGGVPWHELPWDQRDPDTGQRAMFEIDSAGMGCTLIHREVLEKLMEAAQKGESEYPMRAIWKEGKVFYGEDQAFFLRAKAHGYTIFADLECWCAHYKAVLMNPNLARDYYGDTGPKPNPDAPYDAQVHADVKRTRPILDADGTVLKQVEIGGADK